jgi:hypothetical protein
VRIAQFVLPAPTATLVNSPSGGVGGSSLPALRQQAIALLVITPQYGWKKFSPLVI